MASGNGEPTAQSRIDAVEARRAERKAALELQQIEQRAVDEEAIDQLEVVHGELVKIETVRYVPGLVTVAAYRLPKPIEQKRYNVMIKGRGDKPGDPFEAAELLASACVVYPAKDEYKKLCDAFAALHHNAAVACLKAAQGRAAEMGKD
jgi:hypothetical protein